MTDPSSDLGGVHLQRVADAEQQITARLMVGPGDNPFRSLRRRFVVAHAPRVGSHLLSEQLTAYGARVQEFFEAPRIHATAARQGLGDLKAYCRWLLRAHAANGIFGVSGGVKVLAPLNLVGELPDFIADWSFVHLTREDFVAQAVSWFIMHCSGAFRSSAIARRQVTDADYDAERVKQLIDAAMAVNAAWECAFQALGVTPLRLTYETLVTDPDAAAARVAQHLGLVPATARRPVGPPPHRQATALNDAWIARFRADHAEFCRTRATGLVEPQQGRRAPSTGRQAR